MKMEIKNKQKQGGNGVGDTMKMTWNVGSINDEKRSFGEENISWLLLGVIDVKPIGLMVTLGGD